MTSGQHPDRTLILPDSKGAVIEKEIPGSRVDGVVPVLGCMWSRDSAHDVGHGDHDGRYVRLTAWLYHDDRG